MSIESWKQEFYQVPRKEDDDVVAILKGIKKFYGALPENLSKHEILSSRGQHCYIKDGEGRYFSFGVDECGLCIKYYDFRNKCPLCPLSQHIKSCFNTGSGYDEFATTGNPFRMISDLSETLVKITQERLKTARTP